MRRVGIASSKDAKYVFRRHLTGFLGEAVIEAIGDVLAVRELGTDPVSVQVSGGLITR